jgi:hypothetical protein
VEKCIFLPLNYIHSTGSNNVPQAQENRTIYPLTSILLSQLTSLWEEVVNLPMTTLVLASLACRKNPLKFAVGETPARVTDTGLPFVLAPPGVIWKGDWVD